MCERASWIPTPPAAAVVPGRRPTLSGIRMDKSVWDVTSSGLHLIASGAPEFSRSSARRGSSNRLDLLIPLTDYDEAIEHALELDDSGVCHTRYQALPGAPGGHALNAEALSTAQRPMVVAKRCEIDGVRTVRGSPVFRLSSAQSERVRARARRQGRMPGSVVHMRRDHARLGPVRVLR
jgi:hypothetical protein